ncbi:MAG TPA: CsbD family protein [Terricaulis sp.]|nr:CsbD family protein [Terricaulis sp.]
MDKEHVKGAADKVSGAAKEAAGKMTGNKKLEAEGKIDKAKGEAREFIGDVKDAAKKADKH